MSVIELDYPIEGFAILLNEDCIIARFYPLISYKYELMKGLFEIGCRTKKDCGLLTDAEQMGVGLSSEAMVCLFRAFLRLYDISAQKLKEIERSAVPPKEKASLLELVKLPGVRFTRADLYYQSGYTDLRKIAAEQPEGLIAAASELIEAKRLQLKPPLPKEARTHIAVAKVLTMPAA